MRCRPVWLVGSIRNESANELLLFLCAKSLFGCLMFSHLDCHYLPPSSVSIIEDYANNDIRNTKTALSYFGKTFLTSWQSWALFTFPEGKST
jgi:hypothetical protein